MIADQLDMFTMHEADTRAEREATQGVRSLFTLRCARPVDYESAFEAWGEEYGRFGSVQQSHAWRPDITAPITTTETCEAAVLHADLYCAHYATDCLCVGDRAYRGVCRGCDWHGPHRADGDAALFDALDHTHPHWRTLPVVADCPSYDGTPAARHRARAWTATVADTYGPQTPGCPVITDRTPPGTRSVPGQSPWCGYDIAAPTRTRHP